MPHESTDETAPMLAALAALAKRAGNAYEVRAITTLMRKGGRPPQYIPCRLLHDLERIGLVHVLRSGACTLTAIGVEVTRRLEQAARDAYPDTPERTLEAAMARVMRGEPSTCQPPCASRRSGRALASTR